MHAGRGPCGRACRSDQEVTTSACNTVPGMTRVVTESVPGGTHKGCSLQLVSLIRLSKVCTCQLGVQVCSHRAVQACRVAIGRVWWRLPPHTMPAARAAQDRCLQHVIPGICNYEGLAQLSSTRAGPQRLGAGGCDCRFRLLAHGLSIAVCLWAGTLEVQVGQVCLCPEPLLMRCCSST